MACPVEVKHEVPWKTFFPLRLKELTEDTQRISSSGQPTTQATSYPVLACGRADFRLRAVPARSTDGKSVACRRCLSRPSRTAPIRHLPIVEAVDLLIEVAEQ